MLIAWRLAKLVALLLIGAGWIGAFAAPDLPTRQRAVYLLATPGLLLAWLAGYGMTRELGISLGTPWISASIALALASFQGIVWAVEREGRRAAGVVSFGALLGVVALMVVRP